MLIPALMCVAGLLAAWLLVRTRDASRPRILHYLALILAMGVACLGGFAFLLHAVLSGADRYVDASLLWGSIVLITALLVAGVRLKNQAWRQVAGIAGSFLLGAILLTVCAFATLLHALRGPQPPSLEKLQVKFPQRRSQLEFAAAVTAPLGVQPPKSIEEIQREKRLTAAEPPPPSPSLLRRFSNLFSHNDPPPRVVYQNGAILFVYGNQNGPLFGGGRGPSWGYLYCPDAHEENRASICQDAAIHSGADWGPPTLLSLRLDQHWFAYSRGPSS